MARWFTSDLHIGHARINELAGRPFASVAEADEELIARWNAVVGPRDDVWILGDLALGPIAESLPKAKELAGRKHLVIGNHDRPFMYRKGDQRREKWANRYIDEAGLTSLQWDRLVPDRRPRHVPVPLPLRRRLARRGAVRRASTDR